MFLSLFSFLTLYQWCAPQAIAWGLWYRNIEIHAILPHPLSGIRNIPNQTKGFLISDVYKYTQTSSNMSPCWLSGCFLFGCCCHVLFHFRSKRGVITRSPVFDLAAQQIISSSLLSFRICDKNTTAMNGEKMLVVGCILQPILSDQTVFPPTNKHDNTAGIYLHLSEQTGAI